MTKATTKPWLFVFIVALALVWPGSRALASSPGIDATHQVVIEDGQLRVTTRWYAVVSSDASELAAPLPAGTRALGRGVTLTRDPEDQRVVGIAWDATQFPRTIELAIPWAEGDSILALPLPPKPGWQRVEVEGNYRLIPDASVALLHSSGYYAPGDLHVVDRLRIDRGLDRRHPAGAAYLPGAELVEAGGVPARLESGAARKLGLGLAVGGVFLSGLVVLSVVVRRSSAAVEVEDAQAYLDAELDALDDAELETDANSRSPA